MSEIKLFLDKSVEENAEVYFEQAKKAKKKLEGANKALSITKKKLDDAIRKESEKTKKEQEKTKKVDKKTKWYHKFRWFITSEGFLVIGGRDATTNEIIIKKHAEPKDLVFHTDMAGSPFIVIKNGEEAGKVSLQEAADFTATHSKAWKLGMATTQTFYVKPEQVTKQAQPGEYLQKGSFMIRGKTTYITPNMNYAVGIVDGFVMGGPTSAVKKNSKDGFVELIQGNEKQSSVAKIIKNKFSYDDLDEVIRILPVGCKVKK
ncbi:DUF814 domain-containing protein [Candidatus Woesearchaeota archaeon]|nr:DUF814 domain-containing protein [Candidatus Woesearchaeota archaeon]